jgi:hypothetical protein
MSSNSTSPDSMQAGHCLRCGAELRSGADYCWLCGVDTREASIQQQQPALPHGEAAAAPASGFSLASLMMFMTLVSVTLGMIALAPGIGVPLAVIAFFTWLRTVAVVRRRATKGAATGASERVLLFVNAFLSTIALLFLIGTVGVAALFTAVYILCALDEPTNPNNYSGLAAIAALVTAAVIYATVKMIQYKRRRWRRDIGEPN